MGIYVELMVFSLLGYWELEEAGGSVFAGLLSGFKFHISVSPKK